MWHALHRPAKPATAASDALLAEALGVVHALGGQGTTRFSGGGTDGSIMQGEGLPTIDSMGIDGSGAHSPREKADLASLVPRAKVAAVLIHRLMQRARSDAVAVASPAP